MRILLDANTLVRANTRASGPARELLNQIRLHAAHTLVLSRYILLEVRRALEYPRLQAVYGLTDAEIDEHIRGLEKIATMVEPIVQQPVVRRDPADDPIVYAAIDGRVDVLCTRDRDFEDGEARAFCRQRGIEIMNDVDLLHRLRERDYGPER